MFLEGSNTEVFSFQKYCIQMYGKVNGEELSKWDDTNCENRLPYICHVKASKHVIRRKHN